MDEDLVATIVSIPQWCDCCTGKVVLFGELKQFQSHNGAIAASELGRIVMSYVRFQSHNGAIAAISN